MNIANPVFPQNPPQAPKTVNKYEEDLVTYKTAKLLAEIGFINVKCTKKYTNAETIFECYDGMTNKELSIHSGCYCAPSLYTAQEWLRDKYCIETMCVINYHKTTPSQNYYNIGAIVVHEDNVLKCNVLETVVNERTMAGQYKECLSELLYNCCMFVFDKLKERCAKAAEHSRLIGSYSYEWISVDYKLPPEILIDEDLPFPVSYDLILCSERKNHHKMCIGYYNYETHIFYNSANDCMFPATHWILAPKSPNQ